jgi:hypothetical protein
MDDKIKAQIKKLLTLANNAGATEGEVQAAMNRVSALASKHNLSDVDIEKAYRADGTEGARISVKQEDIITEVVWSASNLTRWDKYLGASVSEATHCGCYIGWLRGRPAVKFFGLPEDIAVAKELYVYARKALSKCARRWAKEQREQGYTWIQSNTSDVKHFKDGFCSGLIKAVRAANSKAKDDKEDKVKLTSGTTTALVLVTDVVEAKTKAVAAYEDGLNLSKARRGGGTRGYNGGAFAAGSAAGKATNLSRSTIR